MAKHQSRRAVLSVGSLEDRRLAAVDAFIWFESPGVTEVRSETKADTPGFEVQDFSFGVETPSTIGSATGGAGAGKIKFNEFTIKKTSDSASPALFEVKDFSFGVENPTTIGSATGGAGAGKIKFNEFTIKKTSDSASPAFSQGWSGPGDEGPQESITFVYGKLG
ncbi:MAG TPA: type VI secretion system tube protein Hcp [Gemmataceae bacterium]|nr:type VI secretion system tube protein Hcp [Gemmataceae bacterium]